jgi:hypothetical protein
MSFETVSIKSLSPINFISNFNGNFQSYTILDPISKIYTKTTLEPTKNILHLMFKCETSI